MEGIRTSPRSAGRVDGEVSKGTREEILDVLSKSVKKGTLLASCEPDVREFMHQLDLCLTSKQEEWRRKERSYRLQLENKEKEQSSLRIAIEEREKEIYSLREEVTQAQRCSKEKDLLCSRQVDKLKNELKRLTQNYEKLKAKKRSALTSDHSSLTREHGRKPQELTRLRDQYELLELKKKDCKADRERLASQLSSSKNEISALQSRCLALQENLDSTQCKVEDLTREKKVSLEVHESQIRELENQLDQTHHILEGRESLVKSLRCEQEESLKRAKDSLMENKDLVEKVCSLQERLRHADKLSCELQQHLKMKEESLQALTAENLKLSGLLKTADLSVYSDTVRCSPKLEKRLKEEIINLKKQMDVSRQECSELRHKLSHQEGVATRGCDKAAELLGKRVQQLQSELTLSLERGEEVKKLSVESAQLQNIVNIKEKEIEQALSCKNHLEVELEEVKDHLLQVQQQLKSVCGELEEAKRVNKALLNAQPQTASRKTPVSKGQHRHHHSSRGTREKKSTTSKGSYSMSTSNGLSSEDSKINSAERSDHRIAQSLKDHSTVAKMLDHMLEDILSKHFNQISDSTVPM